jgi:abortive infection bacteriophage resistance protein
MDISDPVTAGACLERIGYYRLSGYWYPFRKRTPQVDPTGRSHLVVESDFRPGTTFDQVMDLYVFDKRLRLLVLDAIERVEVALRVDIALVLGQRSPWAHRDPVQLHGQFSKKRNSRGRTGQDEWLERVDEGYRRSKEEFVKHYRRKYAGHPPIWIAIELWDFGTLSFILDGMQISDQKELANKYAVPRSELLPSWARSINHVRNICAHHCRLWNRSPADLAAPPRLGEIADLDHLVSDSNAKARLYLTIATIQFLLKTVSPGTSWHLRLKDLIPTFPEGNGVRIAQAGFPDGWDKQHLWV